MDVKNEAKKTAEQQTDFYLVQPVLQACVQIASSTKLTNLSFELCLLKIVKSAQMSKFDLLKEIQIPI